MFVLLIGIAQNRLSFLLDAIEMKEPFFVLFYFVLIWDNFRYTEILFEFVVEEGFNRSSSTIEAVRTSIINYFNSHHQRLWETTKLTFASILVMILKIMPAQIKPVLDLVFGGVHRY